MTCQACQTWNSDDEHRCRRCGRRQRVTPTRHGRAPYPIAATALAYQPEMVDEAAQAVEEIPIKVERSGQHILFNNPNEGRVIPFDRLKSPEERQSIRARAQSHANGSPRPGGSPTPVRSGKVEVSARARQRATASADDQQLFDFRGKELPAAPASAINCGAPVASPLIRLNAAVIDGFMVLLATLILLGGARVIVGELPTGKSALLYYGLGVFAISVAYKLIWCFSNQDSFGTMSARLKVVDFDGNPPTQKRRFWRAFSGFLSLGAVGLGLIWTFADEDSLAWHDQISGTFPTFAD